MKSEHRLVPVGGGWFEYQILYDLLPRFVDMCMNASTTALLAEESMKAYRKRRRDTKGYVRAVRKAARHRVRKANNRRRAERRYGA